MEQDDERSTGQAGTGQAGTGQAGTGQADTQDTNDENLTPSDEVKSDGKEDEGKMEDTATKTEAPKEPVKKPGKKVSIDVKSSTVQAPPVKHVASHYSSHNKSSLPHILTEYGMEEKPKPIIKKEKKKSEKSKKIDFGGDNDTDNEEKALKKARENRMRRNLLDPDVNPYYAEYVEFLEQKVQEQRRQMTEREEAEKIAKLKTLEQEKKNRFQRKLERVELRHDDSFLQDLPRSDIGRIALLEDRLKKQGKLKSQIDVDNFWRDLGQPEAFYKQFKVEKRDQSQVDDGTVEDHLNKSFQSTPEGPIDAHQRSLSHISEASNQQSWAITQKFQSSHKPKSAEKGRTSSQLARDAALDLERRCPKLEMPPLTCFKLQLGEKPPDPDEILRQMDLKAREKARKKSQRKLNKMYQMAMTNTAVANRIMAEHNDLSKILEGTALRDVISFGGYGDYESEGIRERIENGRSASLDHVQIELPARKLSPISDASSIASSKWKKRVVEVETPIAVPVLPLSLNEVFTREKTMEAKCLSTLWTNPASIVGKEVSMQT